MRKRKFRKIEQTDSPRGLFGMKGPQDAKYGLVAIRKRRMRNPAQEKGGFSMEKEEKGVVNKLLGKLENLFSIENTEKRVGLVEKILTMLDRFGQLDKKQQKRFRKIKKLSIPKSVQTIKNRFVR